MLREQLLYPAEKRPRETSLIAEELADLCQEVAHLCVQSKRVAFWGFNSPLLCELLRIGILDKLQYAVVDRDPTYQGRSVLGVSVQPPSYLRTFEPDYTVMSVLSHAPAARFRSDPLRYIERGYYHHAMIEYEMLMHEYRIPSHRIVVPTNFWADQGHPLARATSDVFQDPLFEEAIRASSHIPGGVSVGQVHLYQCLRRIVDGRIEGDIINLGVAEGNSMYFFCWLLKHLGDSTRQVVGFDAFAGMTMNDADLDSFVGSLGWDGYTVNSFERTQRNLASLDNCVLIKGNIKDRLDEIEKRRVALAFFDMDDYTPTKVALRP